MVIASQAFFVLFLPASLVIYYAVCRTPQVKRWFLLVASYLFYGLAGIEYLPVLLGLSCLTFWSARKDRPAAGIIANLLALGFFKYYDFGAENLNALLSSLPLSCAAPLLHLALPLGISFFVFKHIGYLLDVKQRRHPASTDLLTFMTYSAFFPQISAGPISGYGDMARQLHALPGSIARGDIYRGLLTISIGLIKKVLIADVLTTALSTVAPVGLLPAWYVVVTFAMQLYFDFSAYTDIVLGVGILFGFSLPQNFDSPYLATSPRLFWERWHMSLSQWFRTYLFFPWSRSLLRKWGGEHKSASHYTANFATLGLIGLWHGAGWNYILWGIYHGLLLNIQAGWERRQWKPLPGWLGRAGFLIALMFSWAIFMSPSLESLGQLLTNMSGLAGLGPVRDSLALASNPATPILVLALPIAFSGFAEAKALVEARMVASKWLAAVLGLVTIVCLFLIGQVVQFAYVQF
ncbi:MAG: MBOAT family protein [Anaerolineales bacterium]|nr:MBOAT family protein [Anaerolineales bacterium]